MDRGVASERGVMGTEGRDLEPSRDFLEVWFEGLGVDVLCPFWRRDRNWALSMAKNSCGQGAIEGDGWL